MTRDLTSLFEPRSVAIVGVSADRGKWGYWFARDAVTGAHRRRVFLVGRSGGELHGLPVHRSLDELPEPPELVVLSVPAHGLEQAVDASLAAGARALVAIAAGFGELGDEGAARERALVERVRAAGALLVGPNCLGVFDAAAELQLASNPLPSGPVGLVSQSGNIVLETALLLEDVGLGFSRAVSVGNQADVDVTDVVCSLAADDRTRVIGVYCEDFRDGRAFAEAARTAGKPVVLLTVGRTAAAARAARSHTGALTSDLDAVDAACRAAGILRVETPRQLVDTLRALLAPYRPRGRRVAVVGDGGGYGAIASDLLGGHGLEQPVLPVGTQVELREQLPPTASTANPVDLAGAGEQDVAALPAPPASCSSATRSTRCSSRPTSAATAASPTSCANASSGSSRGSPPRCETRRSRSSSTRCTGTRRPRTRSGPRASPSTARSRVRSPRWPRSPTTRSLPRSPLPVPPEPAPRLPAGGYAEARAALAAAGVPFGAARVVAGRGEALAVADELGYPVVLKALGFLHKSDAGGVVVAIADEAALAAAVADLSERLHPPALSVERAEDVAAGFELLVGARRDPRFGPVVVVGAGGVHAEIFRDTALALAPVDAAAAEALLRSLSLRPASHRGARPTAARPRRGGRGGCGPLALRRSPSGGRRGGGEPAARPARRRGRPRCADRARGSVGVAELDDRGAVGRAALLQRLRRWGQHAQRLHRQVRLDGRALGQLPRRAVVDEERLHDVSGREPDDELLGRAEVDDALDHPGHAVVARLSYGSTRTRSGRITTLRLSPHRGRRRAPAQDEVAEADAARAGVGALGGSASGSRRRGSRPRTSSPAPRTSRPESPSARRARRT